MTRSHSPHHCNLGRTLFAGKPGTAPLSDPTHERQTNIRDLGTRGDWKTLSRTLVLVREILAQGFHDDDDTNAADTTGPPRQGKKSNSRQRRFWARLTCQLCRVICMGLPGLHRGSTTWESVNLNPESGTRDQTANAQEVLRCRSQHHRQQHGQIGHAFLLSLREPKEDLKDARFLGRRVRHIAESPASRRRPNVAPLPS